MQSSKTSERAPAVELVDVVAGYGGTPILTGVSTRVASGELVGIWGPNGAGKTTLFRVIMGLLVPTQGAVRLFGSPLDSERARRWARRQVGYVAQELAPGALPISVFDAVLLGRWGRTFAGLRRPTADDRQIVVEWIERVGLAHKQQSDLRELSGGQRQRVALARALACNPSLLILDEPTTHLDARARNELIALVQHLHQDLGLTTLLVSHDPDILHACTDRLVQLEDGKLSAAELTRLTDWGHTHV